MSEFLFRFALSSQLFALSLGFGITTAMADEYHIFMSATCAPEIGFFSIGSYGIYNVDVNAMKSTPNLLTSRSLENEPFACELQKGVVVTVKGLCRHSVHPEEVRCALGLGPRVEEIALFVNDSILPLSDPPARTDESVHWLSVNNSSSNIRQSVEISAFRPYGGNAAKLNILHCRSIEGPTARYQGAGKLEGVRSECWALEDDLALHDNEK